MELDVSQAGTGTYADEIGFSNTPEDYNDSTFSSGPSNIIGSENITTTYPGTNITDTSNIYTGDDAYPLYGGAQTYNIIRGGTATNPYPESFFSKLLNLYYVSNSRRNRPLYSIRAASFNAMKKHSNAT